LGESKALFSLWIFAACSSGPVLLGVDETVGLAEKGAQAPVAYEKPEGVFVDVGRLSGRQWNTIRGEVEQQMGMLQTKVDRGRDGIEYQLGRGYVRVVGGQVQMIWLELPYAMRRSQAMEVIGLPPQVREWHSNKRDWVAHHQFGFDRIRMGRTGSESESELVEWVEVRKFNGRKR
jgi:hypothetical protein